MAAPIDFGSSYWNPATISGLDRDEFLLGSALILPSIHLQTTLPGGSFGPFPTSDRSGVSRSNSGVASNLATGAAFQLSDNSPWTLGIGIFGLAGGGVNFAGSNTQPLLTPRNPPRTFGVGPIYSSLSTLEITPIASYQATGNVEELPGAFTRLDTQTDSIVVGLNIQFGQPRNGAVSTTSEDDEVQAPVPSSVISSGTPLPPLPSSDSVNPVSVEATSR